MPTHPMTPKWNAQATGARPVMNVTPLVDVVLVLLIIFMVVIPALEQGLNIEIPGITNTDDKKEGAGSRSRCRSARTARSTSRKKRSRGRSWKRSCKAAAKREPGKRICPAG